MPPRVMGDGVDAPGPLLFLGSRPPKVVFHFAVSSSIGQLIDCNRESREIFIQFLFQFRGLFDYPPCPFLRVFPARCPSPWKDFRPIPLFMLFLPLEARQFAGQPTEPFPSYGAKDMLDHPMGAPTAHRSKRPHMAFARRPSRREACPIDIVFLRRYARLLELLQGHQFPICQCDIHAFCTGAVPNRPCLHVPPSGFVPGPRAFSCPAPQRPRFPAPEKSGDGSPRHVRTTRCPCSSA